MNDLARQVKHNCMVSDARHWGYASLCGLLLRLRGLYRAEHGLMPWDRIEERDISGWIERTEAEWDRLSGAGFDPISIEGREYDPFDSEGINERLLPKGLLYGAGYGMYLKPVFFLAELESSETVDGLTVLRAGRELARDLSTHPAMLSSGTIVARGEIVAQLLWEKFDEMRMRAGRGLLDEAFGAYGVGRDAGHEAVLEVARAETDVYIRHEIGEAREGERLTPLWKEMLVAALDAHAGHARASAFIRAVKDTLADTTTGGMIDFIARGRRAGSLAFAIAALQGYRAHLMGGLPAARLRLLETGDWGAIEEFRAGTYARISRHADRLVSLYFEAPSPASFSREVEGFIDSLSLGG